MGYLPCEAFILNRQDFSFYDVKNLSGLIYIIDKVVIVMQKLSKHQEGEPTLKFPLMLKTSTMQKELK